MAGPDIPVVISAPGRPQTVIELVSDWSRNRDQAATVVMMARGVMGTVCLLVLTVGVIFVASLIVVTSSRGVTSLPLRYIVTIGIGGGSLITAVAMSVARRIRKWLRSRSGQASVQEPDSKP